MEPSKPNEPDVDQGQPIPRSRPSDDEVLEGEVIGRDIPLGRPGATPPRTPPPTPQPGLSFRRTLLLVLVGVSALICLAGALTAYFWYDKTTQPNRSSSTATLQQYLNARFNTRDLVRASVFECQSPDLADVDAAVDEVERLERKFNIAITMSTSELVVISQSDASAAVSVKINIAIPEEDGRKSIQVQEWEFGMTKAESWGVCSAKKLA